MRKRLIIGCLAVVFLLYGAFLMPLPFMGTLWENNMLRHRMTGSITQSVTGLHEDDIILMLGEPDGHHGHMLAYRIRGDSHMWFWQHLIIFLDEDGIATGTITANPAHVM